ncbi:WXG100 family type VII secretion target [Kitasatospora sp. NPDC056327]|uniref:WXG100 family type VII secretion target n=1 Tax=Kitasatospora sp. NPDC056327 TaxID=3345785 RepID=UPI0035D5A0AF
MSYTLQDFKVDLQQLLDACGTLSSESANIKQEIASIASALAPLESSWTGPAGASFTAICKVYKDDVVDLQHLLDEMTGRMRKAYQTYHEMELANHNNVDS